MVHLAVSSALNSFGDVDRYRSIFLSISGHIHSVAAVHAQKELGGFEVPWSVRGPGHLYERPFDLIVADRSGTAPKLGVGPSAP